MAENLEMCPIETDERTEFLEMAVLHFTELNPEFVPQSDWKTYYFDFIQGNSNMFLCWIILDSKKIGFILYGIENHRFLPRKYAMIYELYILPEFRRRGFALACGKQVISKLESLGISRIQLEVMEGNEKAAAFWQKLGFSKFSCRYVRVDK